MKTVFMDYEVTTAFEKELLEELYLHESKEETNQDKLDDYENFI